MEWSSTKQKPREVLVALSRINRTSFSGKLLSLPMAERTWNINNVHVQVTTCVVILQVQTITGWCSSSKTN